MAFNMSYDIISEAIKVMQGADPSFAVPTQFFDEVVTSKQHTSEDLTKLNSKVQTQVHLETEPIAAR